MRSSSIYKINTQRRHKDEWGDVLRQVFHHSKLSFHFLCHEEALMLRIMRHEQTGVVGDEVIADLEVATRCFNRSLPAYPVDYQPSTTAFVSTPDGLESKSLEQLINVRVLLVPFPPCLLASHLSHLSTSSWRSLAT